MFLDIDFIPVHELREQVIFRSRLRTIHKAVLLAVESLSRVLDEIENVENF